MAVEEENIPSILLNEKQFKFEKNDDISAEET